MNFDDDDDLDYDYDEDDSGEVVLVPCPACGERIYEEAERCPECGEWIARGLTAWRGKPWLWIVLGLLGIGAVIYSSVHWRP